MHIVKITLILVLFFLRINSYGQSIVGKWATIDDETGEKKSIVEIYIKNGKAYGKVVKILKKPSEKTDPICDKCTDYRKDKKIIGMTIITDMVKDGDTWKNGEILDPTNGKIYNCKLWVKDNTLQVRGYVVFLFRTQTWLKAD